MSAHDEQLPLRPLGSTGLMVSPIGLGTVKLGRRTGVKYPSDYNIPGTRLALALLGGARDLGINLIDTAPAYGTSEARLGELLEGWRDEWVIATKVGESFEAGVSSFDFSPEATRASIEASLARLRTDRVEIALVHSDGDDLRIINDLGTLDALAQLKDEGKIRAIGMSTKTLDGALAAIDRCDVVMLTYNLRERDDLPAIRAAAQRGVGVLIKKGLQSGHGAGSVDEAMGLILGEPGVTSLVIGTINPEHLRVNVAAARRVLGSRD